jgi:GDPmannose 4,6-dehydratase
MCGAQIKTAFITGITGQDGAYLAEFLLGKGYRVHGLVRWDCVDATARLHYGDMIDANNLNSLMKQIKPDEIYNLAALSHVKVSFETPSAAFEVNTKGLLNLLDGLRVLGMERHVRLYQASSSEMFGNAPAPQSEDTVFAPCSPYGVAKLAAYHLAKVYRESYGMHISNGILFNHESPLRGEDFVTRKIARAVAAIEAGQLDALALGNLDAVRDWGHARDYVRGMWMMMQQETPDDYVLASGRAHSVREFVERAFAHVRVTLRWQGIGVDEIGADAKTGRVLVSVDAALLRPKEVHHLLGDAGKAKRVLGWSPEVGFDALVSEMVNAERGILQSEGGKWRKAG